MLVEGRMLSPWDGFRRGGRGVLIEGRMLRWRRMLVEGRVWSPGGGGCRGEDAAAGCEEDAVMNGKEDDLIPL